MATPPRSISITLRLTPEEIAEIDEAARRDGLDRSGYLRRSALRAAREEERADLALQRAIEGRHGGGQ